MLWFKKKRGVIFGGTAIAVAVIFLIYQNFYLHPNPKSIFQILSKPKAQIVSARIYVLYAQPPRSIHFTNTETLNYLARGISKASEGSVSGYSHRLSLQLNTGREFNLECTITDDGKKMAVGIEQGILADDKFYVVDLAQDSPDELNQALQTLVKAQSNH
jgi:hypothetical protein